MVASTTGTKFYMVKKDLRNKTASEIELKAGRILTAISKSPYFSAAASTIETLATCYETLRKALGEDTGSRLSLAERNAAVQNTTDAIRCLAGYVQAISGGREEIILSSGFSVRNKKSKIGLLPAPVIKRSIKINRTGCIKLMWQGNSLAILYHVYLCELGDLENKKHLISSTRSSAILEGLQSGKKYTVFVSAVSTAGEGPLSQGITVCEAWL